MSFFFVLTGQLSRDSVICKQENIQIHVVHKNILTKECYLKICLISGSYACMNFHHLSISSVNNRHFLVLHFVFLFEEIKLTPIQQQLVRIRTQGIFEIQIDIKIHLLVKTETMER